MDKFLISKSAEALRKLLDHYSEVDEEAAKLKIALKNILENEKNGEITSALKWNEIPGKFYFTEGNLRNYQDLEDAYADFKIEVTGGETLALREFIMRK